MAGIMISPREITKRYGISYQTINYYTNLGFLAVRKRKANSRFYEADEVKGCLARIAELKNKGYSLKLIRDIFKESR